MVAYRESATLAQRLIRETLRGQGIEPGELGIHVDRGPSMSSKTVALLMAELGVTITHSRPYVSNDNPYSESQFKTMKHRPDFPERFGSFQDAQVSVGVFSLVQLGASSQWVALLNPFLRFTLGGRNNAGSTGRWCCAVPLRTILSVLFAGSPSRPRCPNSPGLTNPRKSVLATIAGQSALSTYLLVASVQKTPSIISLYRTNGSRVGIQEVGVKIR